MGKLKTLRLFVLLLCAICFLVLLTYSYTYPENEPIISTPDRKFPWNVNSSRDLRDYVVPENETAVINNVNICNKNVSNEKPLILIVVCSAVANDNLRQAIRETWMQKDHSAPPFDIRTVFLLGRVTNDVMQHETLIESNKHGDIIQEGFIDSYLNLTLKSVMMLKWVKHYCPQATFVLKTDDDMFVNTRELSDYLSRFLDRKDLIAGSLFRRHTPVRNSRSKWYVPEFMYDSKYYPNYVSGGGYVISGPLVPVLFEKALQVPYFHFEDVYLTGIVAKAANVIPEDNTSFGFRTLPVDVDPCVYRHLITSHGLSPNELRSVWQSVTDPSLMCPSAQLPLVICFFVSSVLGACLIFKCCCRLRREKLAISQINKRKKQRIWQIFKYKCI